MDARKDAMFGKLLRRGSLILAVLLATTFFAGSAALKADAFLTVRQEVVEHLLSGTLNQPVRVDGPVDVDLSKTIEVFAKDIAVIHSGNDGRIASHKIGAVGLSIPYRALFGSGPKLTGLELGNAVFEFRPTQAADKTDRSIASNMSEGPSVLSRLPGDLLKSGLAENLRLSNIDLNYNDATDGWNETLHVEELSLVKPRAGPRIAVFARARLHGRTVVLSGTIEARKDDAADARRQISLNLRMDGLELTLDGDLNLSSPISAISARMNGRFDSLQAFLQAIAVVGPLEGTATVAGELLGPLDALVLSGLELTADTATGDRIEGLGRVGKLNGGADIDIALKVNLAPLLNSSPVSDNLLQFEITGFDGRVQGRPGAFSVDDAHVQTSLAVLKLGDTGPITIDRLVRNTDGTVGLKGVHILHRPEGGTAFLDLSGDIRDIVSLSGIFFSGGLQVPVSEIVEVREGSVDELGALNGTLSVSDRSGSLSLDHLSASLTGTDLMSLNLDLGIEDVRRISDISLGTKLGIADFHEFATALGVDVMKGRIPFDFEGNLDLTEKKLSFQGEAKSGNSPVNLDLAFAETRANGDAGRIDLLLSGSLQSDRLDPSDYAELVTLVGRLRLKNSDKVELHSETVDAFKAALDLDIVELVTSGKKAGNVKGHLSYSDNAAALAPLTLEYLGGSILGDFAADFSTEPARLSAKGRVEKWRLGRLLAELGHPAPISSTLYLSFDVTAPAIKTPELLKSLSGRISGSLWGGSIPTGLLELSGLNLVRWLSSDNRKGENQFVCAVLPFSFQDGIAVGRSVVLETKNVQIVGNGSVNLYSGELDFSFLPRPKQSQLVDIVTPFSISGTVNQPAVKMEQPKSARAAAEIVTLPLNLVGQIFARKTSGQAEKPCRLPKTNGPK